MRLLLIVFCFAATLSISQKTVNFQGEELKIYPFDQKVDLKYHSVRVRSKSGEKIKKADRIRYQWDDGLLSKELFIPLGTIADGKYIQFADAKIKDYINLDWEMINNINHKIPFAILNVKDNKLNGEAIYLDVNGDTLIKGEFKDNLYSGKWQVGRNTKDYFYYAEGEKHGPYYESSYSVGKRKKYHSTNTENGSYKNGVLMAYEKIDSSYYQIRITKKTAFNEAINEATYTEHVDGVLREKGNRIDYHPVGDWHYFYSDSSVEKEAQFFSDSVSLGRSLEEWSEGLSNHPYWFGSIRFDAIQVKRGRSYFSSHFVSRFSSRGYKSSLCFGEEQFYHPNGQKHFSYKIKDKEFIPDTLFNANGTQSYFMHKDMRTREFVLSYFDFDGNKIDEERVPFEQNKSDSEYIMMYRGLELKANFLLNSYDGTAKISEDVVFYYHNESSYEDLVAAGDTTFYTYIAHNANDLIAETYFIFEERVRIEKRYNFQGEQSLYERRDYFNDDFTACHTLINSDFGNGFEVHQEFDLKLKYNCFEKFPESELSSYRQRFTATNYEFFPTERGLRTRKNFRANLTEIRNHEVDYLMYNKPFTGKLDLEFKARKNELNVSKNKLTAKFFFDFNEVTKDEYYVRDRFGITRSTGGFELLPDLFSDIPRLGSNSLSKTGRVTGAFQNGKKTGDWVFKHYSGKKICELTYENNKVQGELVSHYFQYKMKKRYGGYWSEKAAEKQYYLSSTANFEDGQIRNVHDYNEDGLELGSYHYELGIPASAAYYNVQYLFDLKTITDSVYLEVKDNELSKLHLSFFDAEMKIEKEKKYTLKNEEFDGLYIDELDSGYFEKGKFTGILSNNIGYDRVKKEYIKNGLLSKIEYLSPDGYKLLEVQYDTASIKLTGSLGRRYYLAPDIKLKKEDTLLSDPSSELFADFKSFYSNGEVHAKGQISNDPILGKTSAWYYYNPEGELVSMITYLNTFDQPSEESELKNFGGLVQFKNGKATYCAQVIEILVKYNCAAADNYEVRQIKVIEDYVNGDTIPHPTRYHKSYFDMGVLQSEGGLVNGIPEGVWKFYDREGGLTSVGKYINGKRKGRWLSGDLTGLGFIGDFCLATDDYVLSKETLQKNVNLIITFYENGEASKPKVIEASRND